MKTTATKLAGLAAVCALAGGAVLHSSVALAAVAPVVENASATDVASTSATLQAQIDPEGADTTYRFQYGPASGAYDTSVPATPGDAGSAEGTTSVSVHLQSLAAGSTYHYRVLVAHELEVVYGPDHSFTTPPAAAAGGLPDGRAYELVSPVNKDGGEALGIVTPGSTASPAQASEDGNAVTYATKIPPEADAPAHGIGGSQLLSVHSSEGWSTQNISPPLVEDSLNPSTTITYNEVLAFSPDLSQWLIQRGGAGNIQSLAANAPAGQTELPFLRTAADGYEPLATGELPGGLVTEPLGATPDLSHVVLLAGGSLVAGVEPAAGQENLYEWSAGGLQLVNVLPNGERGEETGGSGKGAVWLGNWEGQNAQRAISKDGSRVIWSLGGAIYQRNMITQKTELVGGGAEYQTASSDGSKIFSTNHEGDLYAFDTTSGHTTDLAVNGEVQGVLGASEDGSYVYFVADAALPGATPNFDGQTPTSGDCREGTGGAGTAGCNLYVAHEAGGTWSAPRFIAKVADRDRTDWTYDFGGEGRLSRQTVRVSPDGQYLAFMSEASPTGYDNRDASSGQPDVEVYLYDAGPSELVCASCNPTGARPTGELDGELAMDPTSAWEGSWVAAAIPGWTEVAKGWDYYQSRDLSDDGRLFFDSVDALSPADTNGVEDVYEHEPDGVGSCHDPGGCTALISSGAGVGDSSFVDASLNGDDVFFRTQTRLVPQDVDDAFDLYDAHVCSTVSPCPSSVAAAPACASSDACKAAPTSQPTVFGAPPSATFSGTGNLAPVTPKPAVKPKRKPKQQKRKPQQPKPRKTSKQKHKHINVKKAKNLRRKSGTHHV